MKTTTAISILFSLLLTSTAMAKQSCGVNEVSKASAVVSMELDLLSSGLYDVVRNESMRRIAGMVKAHLEDAQVCDSKSEQLRRNAIRNIDSLVIYNTDPRPYSINTAHRLFTSFQLDIKSLEAVSSDTLHSILEPIVSQIVIDIRFNSNL